MMDDKNKDTCDFYSNAIGVLEGSDDEISFSDSISTVKQQPMTTKTEEIISCIPEVDSELSLLDAFQKQRQSRRKQANPVHECIDTGGRRKRPRRGKNADVCNCNGGNPVISAGVMEDGTPMLNIIEINDSPPTTPVPETGRSSYNFRSRRKATEATDPVALPEVGLRQGSGSSDVISLDDSMSFIDVDVDSEVTIHVKWRGKAIETFHVSKTDKMKPIFEHFAKVEGVVEERVLLTHNGATVYATDSADKFKSGVIILDGGLRIREELSTPQADPNQIELKVLRKDTKGKLSVFILRTDAIEVFMDKTANELGLSRANLVFMFDGERLNPKDTPESLDLEGGECIEVTVRP